MEMSIYCLSLTSTITKNSTFSGLLACAGFFLVFGMTQTPDGVFVRPHPGKINDYRAYSKHLLQTIFCFSSSLASCSLFQCAI